jgi:tRNA modification GTPase
VSGARLLTPVGAAGVAVLSVRGAKAGDLLARVGVARLPAPGSAQLVRLSRSAAGASAEQLDEALLLARATDHFELHVHGSPPLVSLLLRELGAAEACDPGPLTLEQLALRALERAPSELGARVLLDQAQGALRKSLEELRGLPETAARELAGELAEAGRQARYLLQATRVVLAGPTNAGKSTLFNLLLGEQRVLATSRPGTTRDAVLERVSLGPWPVDLFDTAGEREQPADALEAAGQVLGVQLREGADWVLRLRAAGDPGGAALPDLWTHAEHEQAPEGAISALADPAGARRRVQDCFEERFQLSTSPWVAGQAVPFEFDHGQALADFAAGREAAEAFGARLSAWLIEQG